MGDLTVAGDLAIGKVRRTVHRRSAMTVAAHTPYLNLFCLVAWWGAGRKGEHARAVCVTGELTGGELGRLPASIPAVSVGRVGFDPGQRVSRSGDGIS